MNQRPIKFRAWDREIKEFTYYNFLMTADVKKFGEGDWDIDDLQQSTGLKDKNGKECYEGDLIRLLDYKEPLEVYFCEDCACFRAKLSGYGNNESLDNEFEIVGNVYEK